METSFKSLIDSASSILILLPLKPYFDQVAAGLSLYLALRGEKDVQIFCPSPILVEFNRLVGVNKIVSEIGNKNLSLRFRDYPASNIERVSYDIENGEFKLMVVPKPGFSSPKKDQIELSYSGVSAETIILVGGANESHFPNLTSKDFDRAKLVHIGVRALALGGKQVMSFAKPASSVSELVATLIKQSGFSLDPDIATNLVMGIEEGSNRFTSLDVTAETFEILAELLKAGGQRAQLHKVEKTSFPQGAIPGEEIKIEKVEKKEAPKDWLEPKIFKGTTIS